MRTIDRIPLASVVWLALTSLGCAEVDSSGPGPDSPGPPVGIIVLAGDRQTGEVGMPLAQPLVAKVTDQDGAPVAGVPVDFSVVQGGGSLEVLTDTTDAQGLASTSWVMGHVLNGPLPTATAVVRGLGGAGARFTARTVLTAGTITPVSGDHQSGWVRTRLPERPSVQVRTPGSGGVPVEGALVMWTVTAGGGSTGVSSVTNVDGVASSYWTLGETAGPGSQRLSARVASLSGAIAEFAADALPPPKISIVSGDSQVVVAGQLLAEPLVVEARDSFGVPVAGVTVLWAALDVCDWWCGPFGAGQVSSGGVTRTDGAGRASVTLVAPQASTFTDDAWPVAAAKAEAGGDSVPFRARVLPDQPAEMWHFSGDAQSAPAGSRLPEALRVQVVDRYGNFVKGVEVAWSADSGSGSVESPSSVTDRSGIASMYWAIGTMVGANNQRASASVPGLLGSPVRFTASATAGP